MSGTVALVGSILFTAPFFPLWEKVTVETITKPVPVVTYLHTPMGSVGRFPKLEKLGDSCQLVEEGRVVGYRLNCK